jgi:hypothetical protein
MRLRTCAVLPAAAAWCNGVFRKWSKEVGSIQAVSATFENRARQCISENPQVLQSEVAFQVGRDPLKKLQQGLSRKDFSGTSSGREIFGGNADSSTNSFHELSSSIVHGSVLPEDWCLDDRLVV